MHIYLQMLKQPQKPQAREESIKLKKQTVGVRVANFN
jgi:hypothetical protein